MLGLELRGKYSLHCEVVGCQWANGEVLQSRQRGGEAPTWNLERGQRKNRGCKEGESSGVGESFRPHCSKWGPQEAVSLHHQGSSEEEQLLAPAGCCPSEGQSSPGTQSACMVKSEILWPDRSVSRRRVCVSNSLRGSRDRGPLKGRLKNSHSTHQ